MTKRRHSRRQGGGGWGFTGAGSIPGTPGTVSNPMVYTGIGDCRAVRPGYDIPYSQYGASLKGLPGMSGGGKSRKGMRKNRTMKQRGGRYGFAPELDPNPSGQAWWAGSYAPVQRIGCEGGAFNPLNPTHTPSSAPGGAANANYWMAKGGAQTMAPASVGPSQPTGYGVGNVDSMYYYAPTGGYANQASSWKDSVGAPVQIQIPYAARAMNQACLTTGGSPPLTGALQQGGKRGKGTKRGRRQRGGDLLNTLGLRGLATGVTSRLPTLPRWLGGPSSEEAAALVVKNKGSNGLNAETVYTAVNAAGLRRSKNENNFKKAMTAPAEVSAQNMPIPAQVTAPPPKEYPSLPMSAQGNGNAASRAAKASANAAAAAAAAVAGYGGEGGRRHKKSRKHRKGHKGRKH